MLVEECFTLRDNEQFVVVSRGDFCVKFAACDFPPGESNGSLELYVVACRQGKNGWQWVQLSPQTKDAVIDAFYDLKSFEDKWIYMKLETR